MAEFIDEDALPDDIARYTLAALAAEKFTGAEMTPVGIDHFARPDDDLALAVRNGRLRRNLQGYTTDTLIGLGTSSI